MELLQPLPEWEPTAEDRAAALAELAKHALPVDAPGAWIRRAVERETA